MSNEFDDFLNQISADRNSATEAASVADNLYQEDPGAAKKAEADKAGYSNDFSPCKDYGQYSPSKRPGQHAFVLIGIGGMPGDWITEGQGVMVPRPSGFSKYDMEDVFWPARDRSMFLIPTYSSFGISNNDNKDGTYGMDFIVTKGSRFYPAFPGYDEVPNPIFDFRKKEEEKLMAEGYSKQEVFQHLSEAAKFCKPKSKMYAYIVDAYPYLRGECSINELKLEVMRIPQPFIGDLNSIYLPKNQRDGIGNGKKRVEIPLGGGEPGIEGCGGLVAAKEIYKQKYNRTEDPVLGHPLHPLVIAFSYQPKTFYSQPKIIEYTPPGVDTSEVDYIQRVELFKRDFGRFFVEAAKNPLWKQIKWASDEEMQNALEYLIMHGSGPTKGNKKADSGSNSLNSSENFGEISWNSLRNMGIAGLQDYALNNAFTDYYRMLSTMDPSNNAKVLTVAAVMYMHSLNQKTASKPQDMSEGDWNSVKDGIAEIWEGLPKKQKQSTSYASLKAYDKFELKSLAKSKGYSDLLMLENLDAVRLALYYRINSMDGSKKPAEVGELEWDELREVLATNSISLVPSGRPSKYSQPDKPLKLSSEEEEGLY